jgi:outer membrane protein
MRGVVWAAALLGASAGAWAQTAGGLTLEEAVRTALERHPDVGKAKAAADVLRGKIREVRAQALPDVAINGGGLRMRDPSFLNSSSLDKFPPELVNALDPVGSNIFSYNVSMKQPLYTAGKVGAALKLAQIEAEGSQADIGRTEQTLALDVVKTYYAVLWAERYRGLVLETQRQRTMHADMARARYENGVVTEVDVLRSDVAVANGKPDVVRAENSIRQGRALLNYYLVEPLDAPTLLAGDFVEKPWDEWNFELLAGEATLKRPELARLRIAERSSATLLTLAKAESRFRADFSTEYGIMSRLTSNLLNPKFTRWNFGVNVTLPVFDGFKRSGMVYQATANQRAAKLEREKVEQQVRLALQQALDEIRATQETVEAARANIRQAERVLEMTQNNYKFGAATTLDTMDAQTALLVARTNLLRGLHDYSVARASLRWTVGRPSWE